MAIDWRNMRPGGSSPRPAPAPARTAGPSTAPASPSAAVPPQTPGPPRLAGPTVWATIRWPVWATLAVTLLRLAGERLDGAPELFSRAAGGGLAWVGITWLVPVFGFLFGWKLQRRGLELPWLGSAIGLPLFALLLPFAVTFTIEHRHTLGWTQRLAVWGTASAVSAVIAFLAWPAIGRLLLPYALLARLPVMIVMGAAIGFSWGTHYDALPPGFPEWRTRLERWLWLGLLPQATIWVAFTIAVGTLAGLAGWYAARSREA